MRDISFLRPKTSKKTIRLMLTGGGSGGHTFPLIAVAREFKKIAQERNLPFELFYIGPDDFTLPYILKEQGIEVKTILVGKFNNLDNSRNKFFGLLNIFINFFKTIGGIFQSLFYTYTIMPDAVFSKGGYGSFPVIFWSTIFFIPIFVHESDAIPGLVNHISGRFSRKIFVSFEDTKKYFSQKKTILTGNPIRTELLSEIDKEIDLKNIKQSLNLDPDKPVVTIIGGSQGSKHINDLVLDILPKIIDKVTVIHQTGKANYEAIQREANVVFQEIVGDRRYQEFYHPIDFFEEKDKSTKFSLKDVYLISDLIIARAGSGLVFEIAALGKPSILIPLPWASRDHQKKNAYEYAQTGAATVVEEENLTTNIFSELVLRILFDENKRQVMTKAALKFAKPQAAHEIAQLILTGL
ncbi:MAG: UDP-N-acetylglucosamine--N-acetylmuramyl-(pentapeptide) pyrophosphoryl-undecaprenol N-acetylglucosamine transferase [Candidatus Pacebacteria bacterium]|nr:UDP-N-acetylglucosamine--N-acetylmuramyl-(pentapeptide) pyrophosphoryl-undecaprenol N-acetylglucosamine transferase [Candidatus Paceibacterota bacterium]MDD5721706.1 UDP-N-acetylglucosamine--N-acetylmuramyl-(pentapeptide) pyrophosphoryl-undecaprenol N-acetylglucosamine transferase [Candidatus Paceibacterota bacterium]